MNLTKKSFMWLSLVAMPLCWTACNQNTMVRDLDYSEEFEEVYPPEPVPKLLTFANGETITITATDGNIDVKSDTLKWEASPLHEGSLMIVRYQVLLGTENETFQGKDASLLSVQTSNEEGIATSLTLNHTLLDDIAENAGIQPGETGTILWKVRAYCGLDRTLSNVTGQFNVTRPEGVD